MSEKKCGAGARAGSLRGGVRLGRVLAVLALTRLCGCVALPEKSNVSDQTRKILGYREDTARLRGLEPKRDVAVERETKEAMLVSFGKELQKPENRAFMAETELLLRQFRVLSPDASLEQLYLRLMGEQVAAYYDPEAKRLVYVDAEKTERGKKKAEQQGMERFVYVHEFCHALEDGHYDLDGLTKASMGSLDANLALTSFAEGNAVLAGLDGVLAGLGVPFNSSTPFLGWLVSCLGALDMKDEADELAGYPPFLIGAMLRPYLDGAAFSNRLRRDAGWQAVDNVYTSRLPRTTAEILYPERRFLDGFKPAVFEPDPALFRTADRGVSTNSLGALGTALWLGGDELACPGQYGFLENWAGDRVYLIRRADGAAQVVWLSLWDRPFPAWRFCRRAERRMRAAFKDVPWNVKREGNLVAVVWAAPGGWDREACGSVAEYALRTRVAAEARPAWRDLPSPIRFPSYENFSSGCEVLGGSALDLQAGEAFCRFSLASGLLLRAESNPDRHYYGVLWDLARHVEDRRSDFTYWKLPLLASWHRRGSGDCERYRWSLVWGLLASGTEERVRVLLVPVWRRGE